jgi:hypothetical protein
MAAVERTRPRGLALEARERHLCAVHSGWGGPVRVKVRFLLVGAANIAGLAATYSAHNSSIRRTKLLSMCVSSYEENGRPAGVPIRAALPLSDIEDRDARRAEGKTRPLNKVHRAACARWIVSAGSAGVWDQCGTYLAMSAGERRPYAFVCSGWRFTLIARSIAALAKTIATIRLPALPVFIGLPGI